MTQGRPINCEIIRRARAGSYAQAVHAEHRLSFVVRGLLRVDHGEPLRAGPGMVMLVPAGAPHRVTHGADVELLGLSFCASCVKLDEGAPLMGCFRGVRLGALPLVVIPEARRAHLAALLNELADEAGRDTLESLDVMRSLLVLVLAEIRRAPAAPGRPAASRDGSLTAAALEFIQRHCFGPISLKDVAAAVHRSPAHVTTVIRRETGHSVGRWITEARVQEACSRLAHTDDPVAAVAEHVGWKDVTHFIRQFRKAVGVTPAAWRRAHRDNHPLARIERSAER